MLLQKKPEYYTVYNRDKLREEENMKLIIAEDETPIREGLRKIIPWNEYNIDQVFTAKDGKEAYDLCLEHRPEILFTDIQMPRMDGINLAEKARSLLPDIHIIFFSSHSDKDYLKSAIRLKAVNYIEKPLVREEILDVLQEIADIDANKTANLEAALRPALFRSAARGAPIPEVFQRSGIFSLHCCKYYRTLLIYSSAPSNPEIYKVSEYIEVRLRKDYPNTFVTFQDNKFCVFMWYNEEISDAAFDTGIKDLLAQLTENALLEDCFCACGEAVSSAARLAESYATAQRASTALFFMGFHETVMHQCPAEESTVAPFEDTENRFWLLLQNQSFDIMKIFLSDFSDNVKRLPYTEASVRIVKKTIFRLYVILNQQIEEKNIGAQALPQTIDFHAGMMGQTFDELFSKLIDAVETYFATASTNKCNTTVALISNYIEENYANTTLSVDSIAQAIHLSPNYISHLFKKEMNDAPSVYINKVRIEKAKILLRTGNRTLSDIAAAVGYSDSNYFMRIFKKLTGTTPSDYRRK